MNKNQLIGVLNDLEASGRALQGSLIARNTEAIWENLAWQEEAIAQLGEVQRNVANGFKQAIYGDPELLRLFRRGLNLVQTNRAMSQRFVDVVGKTLSRLGGGTSAVYGGLGAQPVRRNPILVCRQG
jgi:hypothetical protein